MNLKRFILSKQNIGKVFIQLSDYRLNLINQKMDTRLLKILEQEVQKEKAKAKKKPIFKLKKEKSIMYYSGWHKDDRPVTKEEKLENKQN